MTPFSHVSNLSPHLFFCVLHRSPALECGGRLFLHLASSMTDLVRLHSVTTRWSLEHAHRTRLNQQRSRSTVSPRMHKNKPSIQFSLDDTMITPPPPPRLVLVPQCPCFHTGVLVFTHLHTSLILFIYFFFVFSIFIRGLYFNMSKAAADLCLARLSCGPKACMRSCLGRCIPALCRWVLGVFCSEVNSEEHSSRYRKSYYF